MRAARSASAAFPLSTFFAKRALDCVYSCPQNTAVLGGSSRSFASDCSSTARVHSRVRACLSCQRRGPQQAHTNKQGPSSEKRSDAVCSLTNGCGNEGDWSCAPLASMRATHRARKHLHAQQVHAPTALKM